MPVDIRATYQRDTARAILVDYNDELIWLPKSHVAMTDLPEGLAPVQGTALTFRLSDWIAQQKNIRPDADVDENLYRVVSVYGEGQGDQPPHRVIRTGGAEPMCYCSDQQIARMIAAALILTEGKV